MLLDFQYESNQFHLRKINNMCTCLCNDTRRGNDKETGLSSVVKEIHTHARAH